MSAKPRLFLHIGTHKTGTTSIQRFCANNTEALAKAGIYYPSFEIGGYPTHYAHHMLAHATAGRNDVMDLWHVERFLSLVRSRMTRDQACLISAEPYYRHRLPQADGRQSFGLYIDRVAQTYADFDVTVLVMLRRQDLFLESLYAEHVLATDYTGTIMEFAQSRQGMLDYNGRLGNWSDSFGAENVWVRTFEPSLLKGPVERSFVEWLGVTWTNAFKIRGDRHNVSLPRAFVEFKRAMNGADGLDRAANNVLRGWIEEYSRSDVGADVPALGKYYLTPGQRTELMARYADDNRAVAQRYLGRDELFAVPIDADIDKYPGDLQLSEADVLAMARPLLRVASAQTANAQAEAQAQASAAVR